MFLFCFFFLSSLILINCPHTWSLPVSRKWRNSAWKFLNPLFCIFLAESELQALNPLYLVNLLHTWKNRGPPRSKSYSGVAELSAETNSSDIKTAVFLLQDLIFSRSKSMINGNLIHKHLKSSLYSLKGSFSLHSQAAQIFPSFFFSRLSLNMIIF